MLMTSKKTIKLFLKEILTNQIMKEMYINFSMFSFFIS